MISTFLYYIKVGTALFQVDKQMGKLFLCCSYLEELLNGDSRKIWRDSFFETRTNNDIPVVIIKTGSGKHGIVIDRPDRNMEIAIKPVPDVLSELDVISGVSIMGDGRVLLVLNPERMI